MSGDRLDIGTEPVMPVPKGRVEFYFTVHMHEAEAQGFAPHLESADAIGIEAQGWDLTDQKLWQRISSGDTEIHRMYVDALRSEYGEGTFKEAKATALLGIKKPVFLLDVPEADPLNHRLGVAKARLTGPRPDKPTFEDSLDDLRNIYTRFAMLQNKREGVVRDRIMSSIDRLRSDGYNLPTLFIIFGGAHTALAEPDGMTGIDLSVVSGVDITLSDQSTEAIFRLQNGEELSDEMWASVYVQRAISATFTYYGEALASIVDGGIEHTLALRAMAELFSETEAREMHFVTINGSEADRIGYVQAKMPQLLAVADRAVQDYRANS